MFKSLLSSLLSPKVEARIMISHTIAADNVYRLQNLIQTWGFPGRFRVLSPHTIQLELEGHQASIEERLDQLSHNPLLVPNYSISVTLAPFTGKHAFFRVVV